MKDVGEFRRFDIAFVTLVLLGLSCLIFRDFVFGDKLPLYKDVGSDSINIFYPSYVLWSDYLRHIGMLSWSFQVGMGQSLFPYLGPLIVTPVAWLPKAVIAKALVYQHLLYVLVAGLLFWRFLKERGITFAGSLLGTISLSFSAYMCMGSCWHALAHEVVVFSFLLFAVEIAIARGRWIFLVLAVTAVGLLDAFHLYLCAVLLCLYVPARLFELNPGQARSILRTSGLLAAAAFLGVGVSAFVTIPNFYSLLNSPRGSGTAVSLWPTPAVFQLESLLHYLVATLRWFSNDILGTGNDFRGWQNYFEAPVTYCGLFPLLIFPQVFISSTRRQRILYAGFLCVIILPIVFPWFRHLFWLFQGGYFRAFSLFSIIGVLTLGMTAFSRFVEHRALNLWLMAMTLLVLIGVLYLPVQGSGTLVDPEIRRMAVIFLLLYSLLLTAGFIWKRPDLAAWTIVAAAAVELIYFDRITVANRPTVTKSELKQRAGYNDETVEAVRDIKASDNSFFRVTKTWGSSPAIHSSLNDAMVFGYYGTSSYSSFNNLNYIKFLMAVDAIPPADQASRVQWSKGLEGHRVLSAFAGEKYVLTKDPVRFETAGSYQLVKRYGNNSYLFRNEPFLPLGLGYSRYILEDTFQHVPALTKPLVLLHAVVLSDKDAARVGKLQNLTMDELQQTIGETQPQDIVSERRATSLDLRLFSETRIEGTLRSDRDRVIVIQTPFDPGWHAFVDGRAVTTMKVDVGLLGIPIRQGEQTVKVWFRPPFLYAGGALTGLSCCVFFWGAWRWPRIRGPR